MLYDKSEEGENMNSYMEKQIITMLELLKNFEAGCDLAIIQDDGYQSKEEQKALKKIHKAADKFRSELMKLR